MRRMLRGGLLLLAVGAVGGLLDWSPQGGFVGAVSAKPPGPKGRGPKGPGKKGKDHLQKAYEALTEVSVWMNAERGRPPRELPKLFDRAKDLYRDAVKASRDDDDFRRADELGAAAHDAARGLLHVLRGNAPDSGLPAPPRRDEYELDDLLQRTRDRLEDADGGERGPGRDFFDAARRMYDRARQADRGDGARALQLARAAEAWTHVGEHLLRADDREVRRPDPERRRDRRPPPPDERPRRPRPPRGPERDAPPPPPPPEQ